MKHILSLWTRFPFTLSIFGEGSPRRIGCDHMLRVMSHTQPADWLEAVRQETHQLCAIKHAATLPDFYSEFDRQLAAGKQPPPRLPPLSSPPCRRLGFNGRFHSCYSARCIGGQSRGKQLVMGEFCGDEDYAVGFFRLIFHPDSDFYHQIKYKQTDLY